jgi:ATP-dependent RNA helicase DeaD
MKQETSEERGFLELGLSEQICENLKRQGVIAPTSVQSQSIPIGLRGENVVCESATGSGKTIAFGAVLLSLKKKSLILTPTRELAEQISFVLGQLAKKTGLQVCAVYGGVGYNQQIREMKSADIIVATPGRLMDHMQQGMKINATIAVLDEADRMLDMGFMPDIKQIFGELKPQQVMCYSATYPGEIREFLKTFIKNAHYVKGENVVDPTKLKQVYYDIQKHEKFSLLVHLLKEEKAGTEMIFCNSRNMVDLLVTNLKEQGVKSYAIHGGLTQSRRKKVIEDFHKETVLVLVCTDVAARGLDISHVTHVYNYELPKDPKSYVHRIGRTARAGKSGAAINLVSPDDHDNFDRILRENRVKVDRETAKFDRLPFMRPPRNDSGSSRGGDRGGSRGGGFGGRSSGGDRGGSRGGDRGGFGGSRSRDSGSSEGRSFAPRSSGSGSRSRDSGSSEGRSFAPRSSGSGERSGGSRFGSSRGGDSASGSRGGDRGGFGGERRSRSSDDSSSRPPQFGSRSGRFKR